MAKNDFNSANFLIFIIGGIGFSINIKDIDSVCSSENITLSDIPVECPKLLGFINNHGTPVPVVNIINMPKPKKSSLSMYVIIKAQSGVFALITDDICESVVIKKSMALSLEDSALTYTKYCSEKFRRNSSVYFILDSEKLWEISISE